MSFSDIVDDFHAHCLRDANARVFAGLTSGLDTLPDPGPEEAQATLQSAQKLLGRLRGLNRETMSFDESLDAELAELRLGFEAHSRSYLFNGKTTAAQMPKAGDSIGDGIFMIFIVDPRKAHARIDDILGRLQEVPRFCKAMLARLDTPLARWVAMDVETCEGLPQLFATIENWAKDTDYERLAQLQDARAGAEEALREYTSALKELPTTLQLHVGNETMEEIICLRGIAQSPKELHQYAVDFLKETSQTIEALREKLVAKYQLGEATSAAELQEFLAKKFRVELPTGKVEDILTHYQDAREEIVEFIRERDLFPIPEAQDMNIMRTPSFMAPSIPAGAMMPPAPFREGTRTSLVYLTLSEELVDEHTHLGIPSMMVHEGIPGHHLQLSTASTHKSIVRRHIEANEHAEGWTTMLEDYMLDIGFKKELADEVRFCGKRDLSRIGARVAIDLFFMSGDKKYLEVGVDCDLSSDDPFVCAGALLQAVTGFVPGRVQAELNWYSQERGYPLSYLTGNRMVWRMKQEIAKAQQGKLEGLALDREFHRVYLQSGNMPLRFLRRVLEHEGLLPSATS